MRIVSIDIDPQGNQNRIHLGPFVAGLNAVYGGRGSGKSTISKFIRHLLFGRYRDRAGSDYRAPQDQVGSLQWADANGNSRIISTSDPLELNDYRFNGPYHWSTRHDWLSSNAINALKPSEQPWHRIGGETFEAVFCGRLGETLPERLWAAARELGISIRFDLEDDETFRRIRAEERRLQERLHHLRVDDRDQAWWSAERNRLAARIEELQAHPELATNHRKSYASHTSGADSRPVTKQWRSQLNDLHSRLSSLQRQETEYARQVADTRYSIEHHAPQSVYNGNGAAFGQGGAERRSTQVRNDAYGSWVGYVDRLDANDPPTSRGRQEHSGVSAFETVQSLQQRLADLESKRASVRTEIETLARGIRTLEGNLQGTRQEVQVDPTVSWEIEELYKRLAYADEVLQSWTLYEQTRARLVELQAQVRGHGPYRSGIESSFLKTIERYIRELSAGALRGLPTWALEALRRDHSYITGLSKNGRPESYREVYRDYRPDAAAVDFVVPPSTSPERQIVELAIRMAIIEASAHRIGRLPLLLDDALDGFHGQQLDHIAQVLMQFSRDGQQILLLTGEEEVAQRVRHHQGWISHLTSYVKDTANAGDLDRSMEERYWRYRDLPKTDWVAPAATAPRSSQYRYVAPVQPVAASHDMEDINAVLSNESVDYAEYTGPRVQVRRYYQSEPVAAPVENATVKMPQFFLSESNRIEDAPGVNSALAGRLRKLGLEQVGQFIETDPAWIADSAGVAELGASEFRAMQRAAMLMCCVPQLRAFDARVLVGCGIDNPTMLAEMKPAHLLQRVENFLATDRGQAILRSGTSYELSRITTWIISARRSIRRSRSEDRGARVRVRRPERTRYAYREVVQPEVAPVAQRTTTRTTTRTAVPEQASKNGFVPKTVQTKTTTTTTNGYRFYLESNSPVVDAPSIGPRMAERLSPMGIHWVSDLLESNAAAISNQLGDKRLDEQTIIDWQDQARLVCTIPNLRGHDAQILTACNVRTADSLAIQDVDALLAQATAFVSSKTGQRAMRGAAAPDRAEIVAWINSARHSRPIRAA